MCEPKGSMIPGPGDVAGGVVAGLAGFAASNAVPFAIGAAVDVVAAVVLAHPLIVIACSVVAVVAVTAGRVVLARWLLQVMGRQVVPVGLDRLRPREGMPPLRLVEARRVREQQAMERRAIPRHTPGTLEAAESLSAPRRLAIEAPRPSLADLQALAAEHGYDVVARRERED